MSISDLSPEARLYTLGYTRNRRRHTEALLEVVFLGRSLREVARDYDLHPGSLQRMARSYRRHLRILVRIVGPARLVRSVDG